MDELLLSMMRVEVQEVRVGLVREDEFREKIKSIMEEMLGVRLVKWTYNDDGYVYGAPSLVEAYLTIKDNAHILVDIRASASRGDVSLFWRIGKLYEEVDGVKPKLVLVTFNIDERARELAEELGIDIYIIP